MTLIEKLITEPGEETQQLLMDNHSRVFWVDWREDDSLLADYCESLIHTHRISSTLDNGRLIIRYGDKQKEVPLTHSLADRHITLCTINSLLHPDYQIRMVWDSDGSDSLAFAVLPLQKWIELETLYGQEQVDCAFLKLQKNVNVFSEKPPRPRNKTRQKWWQFWRV